MLLGYNVQTIFGPEKLKLDHPAIRHTVIMHALICEVCASNEAVTYRG